MENKQKICDLLLPALQQTRSLCDLVDLEYIQEQGIDTDQRYGRFGDRDDQGRC